MDCTSNCKLKKHADCLVSAVSTEDLQYLKSYIKEKCSNAFSNSDSQGRNLIHVAASYGRLDVLQWMFEDLKISAHLLRVKDKESGWTAIHKAIYYGNISCVVYLSKLLQEGKSVDHEGHTFLDLAFLDSPALNKKRKRKRLYKVIAKYEASSAGELTLDMNDHLEIFRKYKNGWADGKILNDNTKGLLPLSFVEEIVEKKEADILFPVELRTDLYMWGMNVNFTLGIADGRNCSLPEDLDDFKSQKIIIKDVVLTKFHSVFLTDDGKVFTCGQGLGGRLGHNNEDVTFSPKSILCSDHIITTIAAGNSHTLLLDALGKVFSFGLNDMHQLGHHPAPKKLLLPQIISSKSLKNKVFIGVAAARFHSVIYTENEIYVFGLNAGQLGHTKGEELQTSPKLVSYLFKQESKINIVKASDGATLVLMENGDLYLLQDYVCRKIALKMNDVCKLCLVGGKLSSKLIEFNKPEQLKIAVLYNTGMINLWRPGYKSFKKIYWHNQNTLSFSFIDISMGRDLLLVSNTGVCYIGHLSNKLISSETSDPRSLFVSPNKVEVVDKSYSVTELVERYKENRSNCEEVSVEKVPLLYRAQKCFTDPKNRVFAVIQKDPRINLKYYPSIRQSTFREDLKRLSKEASKENNICDLMVKVNKDAIPCHKFILQSRLVSFNNYVIKTDSNDITTVDFTSYNTVDVRGWLADIYDINVETVATFPKGKSAVSSAESQNSHNIDECIDDIDFATKMKSLVGKNFDDPSNDFAENVFDLGKSKRGKKSAYQVRKEQHKKKQGKPVVKSTPRKSQGTIKMEKFVKWRQTEKLSDVLIQSEDGDVFYCHKCILISRLDYFQNMLDNIWIESTLYKTEPLKICFPSKILNVLLHYLYTDDIPSVKNCEDISFIGEVIVCADQVLALHLKDMCELELAKRVTMKNVVEILEFGCQYNSKQVEQFACEFITRNLSYFLESRSFDNAPDELLDILTTFYKTYIAGMDERHLKPLTFHEQSDKLDKELSNKVRSELSQWRKRSRTLSSMSDSSELEIYVDDTANGVSEDAVFKPDLINQSPASLKSEKLNDSNISSPWKSPLNPINETEHMELTVTINQSSKLTPSKAGFKKLSQKERKKLQAAKQSPTHSTPVNVIEKEEKEKRSWNVTENVDSGAAVTSFRDLLLEEESKPGSKTTRVKANHITTPKITKHHPHDANPWGNKSEITRDQTDDVIMNSPPSRGFSNIMKSQQEEKIERIKQQKKPLTLIQLEERAIEELTNFYKNKETEKGVEIVVRRKKATSEIPLWSRDVT